MSEAKRLRRPPEGGYARGDETRLRVIGAAIELFGERGFAAATTREIAARAGVNTPALQYYFENKEGVYRACAEHISEVVWAHFEPAVRRATEALAEASEVAPLIGALVTIQQTMADNIVFSTSTPSLQRFVACEQAGQEPSIASEFLQERLHRPLNRVCAQLVSRIGGTAMDDPITQIRTMSVLGQLMVFHMAPRTTLANLGWTALDAEKSEFIKSTVCAQTRALLQMWNAERESREQVRSSSRLRDDELTFPAKSKPRGERAES